MASESEGDPIDFSALPEGCLSTIVYLTSPQDACRLAVVCSSFKSAADSDTVWNHFLPDDYRDYVSQALQSVPSFGSKKELFLMLADNPLIIEHGKKSFWLDKKSGKKCFMNSARDLSIIWSSTPRYWTWISVPESRFPEVAELISVCWFEIRGRINSSMLSLNTAYAAYLVFNVTSGFYGFEEQPVEVEVGVEGREKVTGTVILEADRRLRERFIAPRRIAFRINRRLSTVQEAAEAASPSRENDGHQRPKKRGDNWYEVELGEFFNNEENRGVEMSVLEVKAGNWKGGIIILGIEIRPKEGQ